MGFSFITIFTFVVMEHDDSFSQGNCQVLTLLYGEYQCDMCLETILYQGYMHAFMITVDLHVRGNHKQVLVKLNFILTSPLNPLNFIMMLSVTKPFCE